MTDDAARHAAVRAVLDAAGLADAQLLVAGHDRSIAVIGNVPPGRLAEVAVLAAAIRAAGFRYVTLDITDLPA